MMTRCSAASRVPFGGYAALDTASAPRRVGFYRRPSREAISDLPERFDSCQAPNAHELEPDCDLAEDTGQVSGVPPDG